MASIIDGLFAARAGIQAHGTAISVLSDNIANQNTTAFKASRADFADLLAGTLGGGTANNVGSGSAINAVTAVLTQGTFESTGRDLDTAIDGNGYFVVKDTNTGQQYYTRAGNFSVDTEGYLLDQNGYRVQGFSGTGSGGLGDLNVNVRVQGTVDTTTATVSGNLNADADLGSAPAVGSTWSQYSDAAQYSTTFDVYDSLGASHTVTTYFYHTAQNAWQAVAVVDGADVTGGTAGLPSVIGSTNLSFSSSGVANSTAMNLTPVWTGGADQGAITYTLSLFTQYASASTIGSISQNGTGSGSVVGFTVQEDGTLYASLDNGQSASIGTIALSTFANAEGLRRIGNALFAESVDSGEPVIGTPNTGTFGALESGSLELSTADIASDFIKLISLQRGFQGSSRIITNINDLLKEIVNLA